MKKTVLLLIALALLPSVGCLSLMPITNWPTEPKPVENQPIEPPPPPPLVLPEQVTQQNAQDSLRALQMELDYEMRYGKR